MLAFKIDIQSRRPMSILCLGAHCDDIEIGCGATLMRLSGDRPVSVTWVTMSSTPQRASEARRSARLFLRAAISRTVRIESFRDGFLPAHWNELKEYFEALKRWPRPDIIFTHHRDDRHQDHRLISELTWNTFRNHLILEYEVPKFDGDLGQPNLYVPVSLKLATRKGRHLVAAYASQHSKPWFCAETFSGLMRMRGIESNAEEGFAEAFHLRKAIL